MQQNGAALLVTLALIGLLTVILVAFLSFTTEQQSLSALSPISEQNQLAATYASSLVIHDLQTEMKAGSRIITQAPPESPPILYPANPKASVPAQACKHPISPPNLVKQSAFGTPFFAAESLTATSADASQTSIETTFYQNPQPHPPPSRASSVSSLAPALGGRFIPASRWNTPALLPRRLPQSSSDISPANSGFFPAKFQSEPWSWAPPDWILIQSDGTTPSKWSTCHRWQPLSPQSVQHRFAFQLYDIGGLLDLNVAGCDPSLSKSGKAARRGSLGLCDLAKVGFTPEAITELIQWRNGATLQEPDSPPFGDRYLNMLFDGSINRAFLRIPITHVPRVRGSSTKKYLHSNSGLSSRQQLIRLVSSLGNNRHETADLINSLQYLTHFSRALEQPSFQPGAWNHSKRSSRERPRIVPPSGDGDRPFSPFTDPPDLLLGSNYRGGNDAYGGDDAINPAFLETRIQHTFERRLTGGISKLGEPLVKHRFYLGFLRWLTPWGPSAGLSKSHPNHNPRGTAEAIQDAFGLTWNPVNQCWNYDHGILSSGAPGRVVRIGTLTEIESAGREADFFELLKAGITAGSLGKAAAVEHPHSELNPATPGDASSYQQLRDRSVDLQILQIGANLIDQFDTDGFPTLITLSNRVPSQSGQKPPPQTVRGIEDLPYFFRLHLKAIPNASDRPNPVPAKRCPIEITQELDSYSHFHCGSTSILGLPEIWNPHTVLTGNPNAAKPIHFRCIASTEDPDRFYPIGSPAWRSQSRFKIRPSTEFAALTSADNTATIFFDNQWPSSNHPPSLSNEKARQQGFWVDLYHADWPMPASGSSLYQVLCFPLYRLPSNAHPNGPANPPPQELHVDRYHQSVEGISEMAHHFALAEQDGPPEKASIGAEQVEVEVRGSELLFEITAPSLFREPTTLCKPDHPFGSRLRAGPRHWFQGNRFHQYPKGSVAEEGSGLSDSELTRWVGFSFGERPTSWLIATKVVNGNLKDVMADQYGWDPRNGPREKTAFMGGFKTSKSSNSKRGRTPEPAAGNGAEWYSPTLLKESRVSLWRYFQITSNVINLQPALLTVRLQYQSPESGRWITYDERFLQIEGDFHSRFDSRSSSVDPDGSGTAWYPVDDRQRSAPIPWQHLSQNYARQTRGTAEIALGHPCIHAIDPRTSRFGHPVSSSFAGVSFFGPLAFSTRSTPQDRWMDPLPSPDGLITGLPFPKLGPISGTSLTQRPANFSPRQTANHMIPGGYLGAPSDPRELGWFPNQVWDSANPRVVFPSGGASSVTGMHPPRFSDTPWLPDGQCGNPTVFRPGWLVQNCAHPLHQYYADADDIVRRASGAYAQSSPFLNLPAPNGSEDGLTDSQYTTDTTRRSRPVILNRPFQSVAEMSHAFRGTPWKNIDFFTPESGDAALLDLFTVIENTSQSPIVAGKVNANTRQIPVLKALLAGALKDEQGNIPIADTRSTQEVQAAADAILKYTQGSDIGEGPFENPAHLCGRLLGKNLLPNPPLPGMSQSSPCYTYTIPPGRPDSGAWSFGGLSCSLQNVFPSSSDQRIQRRRESVLRALTDSTQMRVWNLFLDVIVQTGKYPATAKSGADFAIESESRLWISLAIDRLTGSVLEQQTEPVWD